jgi:hypothetical protein
MTRPRIRRCCAVLTAAVASLTGAGCGSSQSAGPLQELTAGGKPALTAASVLVDPGQTADGEVYVVNSAHEPVTVTGVSEVVVPGELSGTLRHVAIATTGAAIAYARGWPPPVPVRPAVGGTLPPGMSGIIFGFSGPRTGQDYTIAGVKITYDYHGQAYSVIAWVAEVACNVPDFRTTHSQPACLTQKDKVNASVEHMAGLLLRGSQLRSARRSPGKGSYSDEPPF